MAQFCDFINHECTDVDYYLYPNEEDNFGDNNSFNSSNGSDESE